jgi:hypothetical protein
MAQATAPLLDSTEHSSQPQVTSRLDRKLTRQGVKPVLGEDASAELNRLIAELDDLGSNDAAAKWAYRCLREKNRLTALDAQCVEERFQARLETLTSGPANASEKATGAAQQTTLHNQDSKKSNKRQRSKATIDKSALTLPEPRRVRDREHVKFVVQQPCLICGRRPADSHHLRFAQSCALGRKVSDEFTVPLCRGHHRELHHCGDESAWWKNAGVDPGTIARSLWLETHQALGVSANTR